MKIYEILPNLYLGRVIEHPDSEPGIPIGFTRTSVEVPDGKYAFWAGTEWIVTDTPPQE